MMFSYSLFEVVGVASVVAIIGTAEYINPEGHYSFCLSIPFDKHVLSAVRSFDKLRTNGVEGLRANGTE